MSRCLSRDKSTRNHSKAGNAGLITNRRECLQTLRFRGFETTSRVPGQWFSVSRGGHYEFSRMDLSCRCALQRHIPMSLTLHFSQCQWAFSRSFGAVSNARLQGLTRWSQRAIFRGPLQTTPRLTGD